MSHPVEAQEGDDGEEAMDGNDDEEADSHESGEP